MAGGGTGGVCNTFCVQRKTANHSNINANSLANSYAEYLLVYVIVFRDFGIKALFESFLVYCCIKHRQLRVNFFPFSSSEIMRAPVFPNSFEEIWIWLAPKRSCMRICSKKAFKGLEDTFCCQLLSFLWQELQSVLNEILGRKWILPWLVRYCSIASAVAKVIYITIRNKS